MAHEVGRIESEIILNRIKSIRAEIVLQYITNRFRVIIDSVVGAQLCVRRTAPAHEMLLVGRVVQLFFDYQDAKMTIMPRVVRDWGEKIDLLIEKPAHRNISRASERVYSDSSINIRIVDKATSLTSQYPRTAHTVSTAKRANYARNLPTDMQSLIQSFFHALQKQNMVAKIAMFREHPPSHVTERLCAHVGYPIVIPSLNSPNPSLGIASEQAIDNAIKELGIPPRRATFTAEDLIPGAEPTGVQIIMPILYLDYCAGYLLLSAPTLPPAHYQTCIRFLERYSHALSLALEQNGYFDNLRPAKSSERSVRLVDISATGLRFSHKAQESEYTPGDSITLLLSMALPQGPQECVVDATVVHSSTNGQLHSIAVKFIDDDGALPSFMIDYLYNTDNIS